MNPGTLLVALFLMVSPSTVSAGVPDTAPADSDREVTPELRASITGGLKWLVSQQKPDGSYGSRSHYGRHVAITSLAGLAFVSDGNSPERGPFAHVVEGCLQFVLKSSSPETGLIAVESSHGPMYGHGFSTLFLAEIAGTTDDQRVDEVLRKAVRLIVETQNNEGGWRYHPVMNDADLSVTVCQVMALRAARNVGVHVPKSTIDKAVSYLRESQNEDGGFRYMLNTGGSAFARSAAAVAALQYAGVYRGDDLRRGLDYVHQFTAGENDNVGHFFYGHYYAVQAMFVAGGRDWARWWPRLRDELIHRQEEDGSWEGQAGDEYGTAMALIILQVPQRLLPIFQN